MNTPFIALLGDDSPHLVEAEALDRVLHDLRTPLTLMTARTQLLRQNIEKGRIHDADEFLASLGMMEQVAWKMDAILNNFEDSACSNSPIGKGTLEPDGGPLL